MRKSLPLYEFTLPKTLPSQRQGNNFKNFLFQEQNTGENRKNYKDHKKKKKEQFFNGLTPPFGHETQSTAALEVFALE